MSNDFEKVAGKRGRPVNEERRRVESDFGVSSRRARQLIAEWGLDKVKDINELKLWEKRVVIALKQCLLEEAQIELDRARKKLVEEAKVEEEGVRIGAALSAEVATLKGNLPGKLAGLPETPISAVLGPELDRLVESLLAKLGEKPWIEADEH